MMASRRALWIALVTLCATARGIAAQATPPTPACDPRVAATGERSITPAFIPSWLVGSWTVTLWVNGAGVPDTVISGPLILRPRVLYGPDSVYVRNTPLIGHSMLEIEYVPGIEPFRTPVESRSDRMPGVELRMELDGPVLVFGNPTVLPNTPVILGDAHGATFTILRAFTHEFQGQWSLSGSNPQRPWGGFCAVRTAIE